MQTYDDKPTNKQPPKPVRYPIQNEGYLIAISTGGYMNKESIVVMRDNIPVRMTGGNDYLQGKPFTRVDYGGMRDWYRDDTYMITQTKVRVAVAGPYDKSQILSIHIEYSRDCACCFLGHTHSVAYHSVLTEDK